MTPPLNRLIQSSFQKHPFVTIGIIVVVCLVPFANKAVQTDDALFIWTGQWIQKHPVDFFGCTVNWWGSTDPMWAANWNPPLMSYLLAGTASLFGWHEIFLHLACILVAIAAAAGTYALSKMWCERPLLAAVIVIFTPAFLVSGTTLMCDMLMLSFWIWALVFYERALGTESSRWQFIVAGVFVSLAILTKYSAVILIPLMLFGGAFRMRKLGWWLLWLVVPTSIMACYEGLTIRLYGHGLLSMAGHYAQSFRFGYPGGWMAKGIISLAFLGGSLLPALFFTPWLWRWQTWTSIGTVILSALFGTFWLGGDPGLIHPWIDPGAWQNLGFRLQVALLTTAGLHLFLIAGTEALQRKDRISMLLAFWIISVFLFACVLNWTISARSLLPAAPAAAILIVRRLEIMKKSFRSLGWLAAPMSLTMAVTLCLAVADFKEANLVRSVAEQIFTKYRSPNHKLWIEGHGGFQYYLQALGAQPIDNKQSVLQPEDVVAVSWSSGGFVVLPPGSLGLVSMLSPKSHAWMNLSGGNRFGLAGFYDADWGPIPFTIGESDHGYLIAKMFTEVSCFSGPESAPSQAAGHFGKHPGTMDKNPVSPDISKA
ncbi:MAG TPA: glycosyltransferase family 39 protein, partial [Verrucomicrobiae bacterium]|nr:glycosyltransferase family 39 protein [Verrucomicrobiae bacterium]